jgi:hypothetical protein
MASDVTVTVRYKDLNLNPLEHDWEINPRLYEGIRNVDYSGMTDLVEVIDRKISDDGIGDASSQDRDEPGGPHTSRRTSQNFVLTKFTRMAHLPPSPGPEGHPWRGHNTSGGGGGYYQPYVKLTTKHLYLYIRKLTE